MNAGLVLSGGIAKGAYQIGVLHAFNQYLPQDFFSYVSASSVGVLNAYAYLTNQLDIAEEIWKSQNYSGMIGFLRSFAKDSYIDSLMLKMQHRPLRNACDFYIAMLSLSKMHLSYTNVKGIEPNEMWKYLKAGVALPPFRAPVNIHNEQYFDGAMVDNIPVYPLVFHNPDLVIVQYFDRENIIFESEEFSNHVIRLTFEEEKVLRDSFAFDRSSISEMIDKGKRKAIETIREYRLDSYTTVDDIYKHISKFPAKQAIRITGDMLVNNLNIVAKKLIKYSVMKNTNSNCNNESITVLDEPAQINCEVINDGKCF